MEPAGTERALLSLFDAIDERQYDVTLLLARKEGLLLPLLPSWIRVCDMGKDGELFLLSAQNALPLLFRFLLRHPTSFPAITGSFFRQALLPETRREEAAKLFVRLMKRYLLPFEPEERYDAVLAFYGGRTVPYACEKVRAGQTVAWQHFTYAPEDGSPEDDRSYFEKADRIAAVSAPVRDSLLSVFPSLSEKTAVVPNLLDVSMLRRLAGTGEKLPSRGIPLLTVSRISVRKGVDRIPFVLSALVERGHDIFWYVVGKDEGDQKAMLREAVRLGVADRLIFPGPTANPYGYYASARLFILPSDKEGYPVSVEEAKALGLPSVVLPYGAAKEQLRDGRYGIVTNDITDAVDALLKDEKRRLEIIRALKEIGTPSPEDADVLGKLIV